MSSLVGGRIARGGPLRIRLGRWLVWAGLAGAGLGLAAVALAAILVAGLESAGTLIWPALILAAVGALLAATTGGGGMAIARLARRDAVLVAAIDALPEAIVIATRYGHTEYGNHAAVALRPNYGRMRLLEIIRSAAIADDEQRETLARLEDHARAGRQGRGILALEFGKDRVWLDAAVLPLADGSGRVVWRFDDVTAATQLRQVVEEERAQLYDFFDEAPIGLYSIDEGGRFRMVNRTLAGWLGAAPEGLVKQGARLFDFVRSEQPTSRPPFDPFAPAEDLEVLLQGRQGRMLGASVSQTIHRQGQALRTRSVVRDLAPERAWEDALRLSRQRFQRLFEIAPVGIALADIDGRLKETNRALDELLSDGRERVVGLNLFEFVVEELHGELTQRLTAVAQGAQSTRSVELRLRRPREKTVALFVGRLEATDGSLAGVILHFIDLSEQKSLEAQFAQSQKMQAVGQLAGGVAHDFNNLLTAMIGFCDLLLLRFRPGDQSFADIMQIKQNANRAANLVRQLLAFSRQQTLQPRIIDISDVLAELSHLLNRLLGENVELKVIHGRELPPVRVDQGQLEQVIINLAVNARDAMAGGGILTIRTSSIEHHDATRRELELMPAGGYLLIEVSDTGCGIPRDILGRIFEPFFSTKEVGSGTGLGLSTVYGIVKQTGGFIFVESEVGSGTKFSIYLPRYLASAGGPAVPAAEPAEPAVPRDLTGAGTVLLVEDEDPVRLFSARALRNKGYTVLEAKSGEAALKIIEDGGETIDLIVTDVVMPRMDGPTLIKVVRERLPDIAVIFISGYAEDAFRKRIDDDEAIHFLAKPFSLKDLAAKVKEIMPVRPADDAPANPSRVE